MVAIFKYNSYSLTLFLVLKCYVIEILYFLPTHLFISLYFQILETVVFLGTN